MQMLQIMVGLWQCIICTCNRGLRPTLHLNRTASTGQTQGSLADCIVPRHCMPMHAVLQLTYSFPELHVLLFELSQLHATHSLVRQAAHIAQTQDDTRPVPRLSRVSDLFFKPHNPSMVCTSILWFTNMFAG